MQLPRPLLFSPCFLPWPRFPQTARRLKGHGCDLCQSPDFVCNSFCIFSCWPARGVVDTVLPKFHQGKLTSFLPGLCHQLALTGVKGIRCHLGKPLASWLGLSGNPVLSGARAMTILYLQRIQMSCFGPLVEMLGPLSLCICLSQPSRPLVIVLFAWYF